MNTWMEKLLTNITMNILDVTASDCKEALLSEINDYEDAVISCCAAHNHMDYIVIHGWRNYLQILQ